MTLTLSGTTITQTGTDTITSTSTIAGTTKTTINGIAVFDFGNNSLKVSGTLTVAEGAALHGVDLAGGSGTLQLGELQSNPDDYDYNNNVEMLRVDGAEVVAITLKSFGQSFSFGGAASFNKAMEWRHSLVLLKGRFDPLAGGVMTDCVLNFHGTTNYYFIRSSFSEWRGNVVAAPSYFSFSSYTTGGTYTYSDIKLRTGQDLVHYGSPSVNRILDLSNVSSGTGYTVNAISNPSNRNYTLNLYQDIVVRAFDAAGGSISDAKVFVRGAVGNTASSVTNAHGVGSLKFHYHRNAFTAGVENRTEYHNGSDGVTLAMISYHHVLPPVQTVSVQSATPASIDAVLVEDACITEADQAVVNAYTSIDTTERFYDRAKSWLVDNYNGEAGVLVHCAEDTITTTHNVIIDPNAPSPFAFDGTTLTIKASTFTGNITTTGTVTLENGASVDGVRTDSTGVKTAFTLTISDVRVGSRIALMDDSGAIIHGANAMNSTFRYTFPEGYTGDLTWAVYKEGYTATVGSSNIKAAQTSFEATASQTLMQNSRGEMYANQGGGDISITYDDFSGWAIVEPDTTANGMEYKWTAQAFIDAFCDFIATSGGMKWLLKHGADAVPQFLYGSAGLQEIVVKPQSVACDGDGNKITVEAYCRDAMNITTQGSFTWEGAAAAQLSTADLQALQAAAHHAKAANLQTQRSG